MNLKEIKELVELIAEKELAEFEVERQGFRLRIKRYAESAVVAASAPPQPLAAVPAPPLEFPVPPRPLAVAPPEAAPEPGPEEDLDLYIIKSPIVGTFYRAPSPTATPFVKLGDHVEVGTVLCIVEAMKLMNEIESDTAGTVVKIYMENGQPVEYGQALYGLKK